MRKTLIILLLAAVLVLVGLWAYVRSDDFESRIRPLVEAPLRQVLGPEARFGRIRASLVPLSLEVRDIALTSPGEQDLLAVRKVTVYLNPLPLVVKTVSIGSIGILEPRITANRDASGKIGLQAMIVQVRKNLEFSGGRASTSWKVKVGTITVRNGTVRFTDVASSSTVTLSRLNLRASLGPKGAVSFRVSSGTLGVVLKSYAEQIIDLRAAASLDDDRIVVDSLEGKSKEGTLSLSGNVQPTPGAMDLKVSLRLGAGGKPMSLLRKKTPGGYRMDSDWRLQGTFSAPVVDGTVRLGDVPIAGMVLKEGSVRITYRDGTGTVSGTDWEIEKNKKVVALRELRAKLAVRSSGLDVIEAHVRSDDASVFVAGRIDGEKGYGLVCTIESNGKGTTLSTLAPIDIAGSLVLHVTISGPLSLPEAVGTVSGGPVTVRSEEFQQVSGNIRFREKVLTIDGASIRQGPSRYLFNGSVDFTDPEPVFDAKLTVIKSDVVGVVALFYERIPLDLSATGEITFHGTTREFNGTGKLELGPGVAYGEPFDKGTLTVELSTTQVTFTGLRLLKKNGIISGTGWIAFNGTYSAQVESRGVDLAEVKHLEGAGLSGPFTLDIRSSGPFSKPVVTAHAESDLLKVAKAEWGKTSADFDLREGRMTLSALIAGIENRTAEIQGTMGLQRPYPWSVHLAGSGEAMNPAGLAGGNELLDRVRLTVRGDADLDGQGSKVSSIHGRARITRLLVTAGDYRLENEGESSIRVESGNIVVRTLVLTGTDTKLSFSGSAHPGKDVDLTLRGDANLSLLRLFYREVEHGDGTASVSIRIRDRWDSPDIGGELTLREGQIKIKDVPQKFTALNGTISFDRGSIVSQGITGEVGGGTVTFSGSASLAEARLQDFSAKAVIDNVTVRYPQGLTAVVGGSLFYDGDPRVQTLSGEVAIQRARYEKRVDWKSMLVDFRAGFARKKQVDIGWIGETRLNVHFYGKESIQIESNLARMPVDVDMLIAGTVTQPQILGRIEARRGEVYFRKNVFRIVHASADFADPNRINPLLDVQAETRIRDYQIRLSVTGTADRSFVSFVSDPPLTDSNILALLTIGRTGEEVKGKESGVGVGEATSFMTGKFQDLLESRARSLTGLDRFQVDPYISKADVSVPRVTVGKEVVQDKVFMTYSSNVGATTPEQFFRIEYLLNRNVSLVGERNETGNVGADVKFRFEFR